MDQSDKTLGTWKGVVHELFDPEMEIKLKFQEVASEELVEFAEAFSRVFETYQKFAKDCELSQRALLTSGLIHGVIDDLLVSIKLMLMGNLSASGNLVRQATEGICMAILCAHPGTIQVLHKGKPQEINYPKLLLTSNEAIHANKACAQLALNQERLGLSSETVAQLKYTVSTHHSHSHAGFMAMVNRMDLSGAERIHYGGHFDPEKAEGYKTEIRQRTMICRWAGETISRLWPTFLGKPSAAQIAFDKALEKFVESLRNSS